VRKYLRILLVVVLILLALAISVDRVHACSCGMPGLPAAELEASPRCFSERTGAPACAVEQLVPFIGTEA
jgi:hypothetical protein